MSRRHGLIGASKPYLYKEEDAEFYYRQTSGGVLMNNSPLVGSIDRIKGQTVAWNQYLKEGVSNGGLTITNGNNGTIIFNGTTTASYFNPFGTIYGTASLALKDCPAGKYLLLVNVVKNTDNLNMKVNALNGRISFVYNTSDFTKSYKAIGTCSNLSAGGGFGLLNFGGTGTVFNDVQIQVNLIYLTLIYGAGNEPSTPEEFEADYFKWFGKPLTYEPYDEGSLRNVQMEGIKTTFTNANPQTRNFDVTSITGKLNGEGESVVIFPDGMKGVNDVKDEIYIEDGVTKAVKRVGRVDLGSLTWEKLTGATENDVYFRSNKPTEIKEQNKSAILCSNYKVKSWVRIYRNVSGSYNSNGIGTYNGRPVINDSSYTDAATFKTAMSGVYLDYELAEPQVYVLDTPLPIAYNCEAGGTEQILPEEIGTGIAPIMDITYNIGQINN